MNTSQANPAMPNGNQCPQCGAPLPAGALAGLCPACLLKQGAAADTAPPSGAAPFTPPSVAELAKLFPQLEILELIGQGGMGAVYKARQPALDRFVALKVLPPQAAPGVNFAERFNREARALAKLSHPNIVGVYDFGQAGALHYFIMEFVDGANLRQLIRSGRLAPREALAVVPQICDALQFAHDEGVVHRDIKPENILVDRRGRVKITDFGLAKILGIETGSSRLTREGQVMGTPHYMAPEQVEHPQMVDHRADIYSLGVVFYEMLTGELPLGKFPMPSQKVQVDVRLDEVVLHALEKEPERRYQQASQVKTAVEMITLTVPLKGGTQTAGDPASAGLSAVLQQVKGPVIGLLVTGIMNGVVTLLFLLAMLRLMAEGGGPPTVLPWLGTFAMVVAPLAILIISSVVIFAALKMQRLENYSWAIAGSILAILFGAIGLPIGIWALVVLVRPEVRAAFRQKSSASPKCGTPTVDVPATASPDAALRQVKGLAFGLIATAVLNWIAIPAIVMAMVFVGAGPNSLIGDGLVVVPISAFVLCTVMLVGALKMRRLESQTWAVAASMLAIFIAPGNIIGFPLGIWAMFVLGRPEVRAAFRRQPPQQEPTPNDTLLGRLALGLFLGGLLGTILIMAVSLWQAMALGFGAVALVLALVFGLMGRRERLGRLAVFCALVALVGVPASFFSAFWTEQACSIVTLVPRVKEEERAHIARAEAAKKSALAKMAQITQSVSKDIQPDGTIRFKTTTTQRNTTAEPLSALRFHNSDFITVDKLTDAQGRELKFSITHTGQKTLRYDAPLEKPVQPGAEFAYVMEGTETGLVKPLVQPGEFEYTMRHWPGNIRTRRIERHLLPAGARLISKAPADLAERTRDGRVELFIDRLVPDGDSLEISYRWAKNGK